MFVLYVAAGFVNTLFAAHQASMAVDCHTHAHVLWLIILSSGAVADAWCAYGEWSHIDDTGDLE